MTPILCDRPPQGALGHRTGTRRRVPALRTALVLAVFGCARAALGQLHTGGEGATLQIVLQVDGHHFGYFQSVVNIGSESEVAASLARRTDPTRSETKQPGDLKWNDVVLRRALTDDFAVWNWRQQIVRGEVPAAYHNFSIILQDTNLQPIARWDFIRGWPAKVSVELQKEPDAIPVEELVLTHEGVERVQ